jgi:RHS repeat-associated protein
VTARLPALAVAFAALWVDQAPAHVEEMDTYLGTAACPAGQVRKYDFFPNTEVIYIYTQDEYKAHYLEATVCDNNNPHTRVRRTWGSSVGIDITLTSSGHGTGEELPCSSWTHQGACVPVQYDVGGPTPGGDQPANERERGGPCPACGNPINPATGNKYQSEVDYRGPGNLSFVRTYNSYGTGAGDIGGGWQHNYTRALGLDYGVLPAYAPGSAGQSAEFATAEQACEDGWALIREQFIGLANTTAVYEAPDCRLYDGGTARGVAPIYNSGYTPPSNPSLQALHARRADGKGIPFAASGGSFSASPDVTATITSVAGGYSLKIDDTEELYDQNGKLQSITDLAGYRQTLAYDAQGRLQTVTDSFGRSIGFTYDGSSRIQTFTDPAGKVFTYGYAGNNLSTVTGPDNKVRRYFYEDSRFPSALTGIADENSGAVTSCLAPNSCFASWTYDASGRAITSEHASGADRTQVTYNGNGTSTVEDGLGAARTYAFGVINGVRKIASITQPCVPGCGTSVSSTTYDPNGFVDVKTDFNGNVTDYSHNTRGLEEARTEAYGTPLARTITTQWHATYRLPTQIDEPGRRTTYTYFPNGRRQTETITDTATGESRTTTWTHRTFNGVVLGVETVDGPRADVNDVTTYAYWECTTGGKCGRVRTITNALGQVTDIASYDAHGNPLTIVDPNSATTTLTYDLRQRLKTRTVAGALTNFDYDGVGQLDKSTLPGGAFMDYDYDPAHRLTDVRDNLGNHIHYTLDDVGNRRKEEAFDAAGVLKRAQSQTFNVLGRLEQVKNATNVPTTEYGYDAQGNRTSRREFESPTVSHTTTYTPDALNRVTAIADAAGTTQYGYTALDQLASVEDPTHLTTTYTLSALGDLKQLDSPDTGITQYPLLDSAGNRKRQIDARGVQVDYAYDALNRLTFVAYPGTAEDVAYTYDGTNYSGTIPYGKGRLTGIVDQSGVTTLMYDARGTVKEERRAMGGTTYVTAYGYDTADRLTSITYPGGRVATYLRNALGQVYQVTTTVVGGTSVVADNITHMPFGDVTGYTLGNGVAVTRHHNSDGRVDELKDQGTALIQNVIPYYDLRGDIEATVDLLASSRSQTFTYDALSRLKTAEGLYGLRGYDYDGVGNRLYEQATPLGGSMVTDSYVYPANSHRLVSAGSTSFTHDGAGNSTAKGGLGLTYNNAGRASVIGTVGNTYDSAGKRVVKSAGNTTTLFHYDWQGHLIEEKVTQGAAPPTYRDYLWLGDLLLSSDARTSNLETIVDNTSAGFTTSGTWGTSTTPAGYYGADYRTHAEAVYALEVTSKTGPWTSHPSAAAYGGSYWKSCTTLYEPTATWTFTTLQPGQYRVYVLWITALPAATDVQYSVTHSGGASTYSRNQSTGGGAWNLLGTHTFGASGQVSLERLGTYGCVTADAVRLEQVTPTDAALWAAPAAQQYEVFARWPASTSHSSGAVYRITHVAGTTDATRDQKTGGGVWNSLGTYTFSGAAGQGVKLTATNTGAAAADAVRFLPSAVSYYHLDHLGTPQKLTNLNQQVVWDASYEPFGKTTLLTSAVAQPLRFPGQYFDAETGLHQNWHRDYDPSIGRYLQSDPIGLRGGLNTYGYAFQNPVALTDPEGLMVKLICRPVEGTGFLGSATRQSHCFVNVTCPEENINNTYSLFGRFPYLESTGYKSSATPETYKSDPSYPDNPDSNDNNYSRVILPKQNCGCEYEKEIIRKFEAAPSERDYYGFETNSNSFAQELITSPNHGVGLPSDVPSNAPGFRR